MSCDKDQTLWSEQLWVVGQDHFLFICIFLVGFIVCHGNSFVEGQTGAVVSAPIYVCQDRHEVCRLESLAW